MIKSKKVTLAIFFGALALMSFHPMGRMVVKWILPLGWGIMDLIGTVFLVTFLAVVLLPRGFIKKLLKGGCNKKINVSKLLMKDDKIIQDFVTQLSKNDRKNELLPLICNVIDIGQKYEKQRLVIRFINYYGSEAVKLLESKEELLKNNLFTEIQDTIKNIDVAILDIKIICNIFIQKIVDDDLYDICTDISMLRTMKSPNNNI